MPIIAGRASAAYGAGFGKAPSGSAFEPVGAFDALATIVVPSGGAGVVTFTAIPSNYRHLQIRTSARLTSGSATNYMWARFNGDGNSIYSMHQFLSMGASSSSAYNGTASFNIIERLAGGTAVSNVFGAIVWDIYDYTTTKTKTSKALGGVESNTGNTNGQVYFNGNLYTGSGPIQSIELAQETANFVENTIISLYGVK